MDRDNTPNSINDLLAALADGELDLRDQPDALAKIAQDPRAAERIACQQQLKQACAKAMCGDEMKCPDTLAAKLLAIAEEPLTSTTPAPQAHGFGKANAVGSTSYTGPSILARIGRWAPAAVAAVLLIAAGVLFTQANAGNTGINDQAATFLSVQQIRGFSGRHNLCSTSLDELMQPETFGEPGAIEQLPGRMGDYFHTSTDGMRVSLDGIGYDYQLAGACTLPGDGAVHIVYHRHDDPARSISLWVLPAKDEHAALEQGRVYMQAESDLMHPVIFWRSGGLLYYLVGDDMQDANLAVQHLRQGA